jgi:peroxiredoxin
MDAYRDQYAKIFNNGEGVRLLAISTDADSALHSWARDKNYPFTFLSDLSGDVGRLYGASVPGRNIDNRSLFIVDRAGKIAEVMAPFREVDASAYRELEAAVARTLGGT